MIVLSTAYLPDSFLFMSFLVYSLEMDVMIKRKKYSWVSSKIGLETMTQCQSIMIE